MSLYDLDQFHFSENEVSNGDYRMIEEFGDFYSSCEFNKPFCWVMKLNRLYCVKPVWWSRFGAGIGGMVSREAATWKKKTGMLRKLIISNRD